MKNQSTKTDIFQPLEASQIPVSWDDIEPTGEIEKIFRLKKDGTRGIKIHHSQLPEEQRLEGTALLDWLSEGGVPTEHKSGLDALIETWNR